MKKMRFVLMLLIVILLAFSAQASTARIYNNGNCWFLPDGRIIQAQRVVTEDGPYYPDLCCYDQQGNRQWTHRLGSPAFGIYRSYCQRVDDNMIAFLYYNEDREYFIEYIDPQGELVHMETLSPDTAEAVLFEQGAVICEREDEGLVLTVRHWDGSRKSWLMHGVQKMTLHPAEIHGGKLYIEVNDLSSQNQTVRFQLCIDASGENVWEYKLEESIWPIANRAANENGGITLFVPHETYGQREMQMIALDAEGKEISRVKVENLPPEMAWNLVAEQKNGLYQVWGYHNDQVVYASLNAKGEPVEQVQVPVEYATCVRWLNDEVYVMVYGNGIEYFDLVPFDELLEGNLR